MTALIPGLPEKIPVYGIKETRNYVKKETFLKLQTFVFNGQDRVPVGVAFHKLGSDSSLKEFQLFSHKGFHNLLTGTIVNGNATVYDNKGQSIILFTGKKSKKKGKVLFEAKEMNSAQRKIAEIQLSIERVRWEGKKLKELRIQFTDVSDYLTKPQVVMSAFMLIYKLKLV